MNFWYIFFQNILPISLSVYALSMTIKGATLLYLYSKEKTYSQRILYLRRILSVGLLCSMVIDSSWIIALLHMLSMMSLPPLLGGNWIRLAWLCGFMFSLSIALFIQYLTQKERRLYTKHYLHFMPSILVCCTYTVYVITHYQNQYISSFEQYLRLSGRLSSAFLIVVSTFYAAKAIKNSTFSQTLRSHFYSVIAPLVTLLAVEELINMLRSDGLIKTNMHSLLSAISTLCLAIAMYIVGKQIFRLHLWSEDGGFNYFS